MQAVILAAGIGERLKPLTETMSKVMIPIANKPTVEWIIDSVRSVANEIILVIRKEQKDVIEYFKNDPTVKFAFQEKILGTANAVYCCKDLIRGRFLVLDGDGLVKENEIKNFVKKCELGICGYRVEDPEHYGVLSVEGGYLKNIEEKPKIARGNLVNASIYLFNEKIFSAIEKTKPSQRGEYEITDSINLLHDDFKVFEISKRIHIGLPWNLLDANQFILEEKGTMIGSNVTIRPGAYIEHPVAIGDNSIIGPNCFIRKYSSVGKNCKVGNAVEIKNSIIMENTFVSHLSYVGDSIIGRNCNIAAGTIFANLRLDERTVGMKLKGKVIDSGHKKLGGIVGDGVKFGVGCLVMPGKKIWPNLLIPPRMTIYDDIEVQPDMKIGGDERTGYSD